MNTALRAAALGLALVACAATPAALAQTTLAQTAPPAAEQQPAENLFRATTFNLSAYGETLIAPDMATITLGVTTDGKTAVEAMQGNASRMTAVIAALRKAGIAAKDIQTSGLSLNPQYRYEDGKPPILTGYQAANQVAISVLDLTRLGTAVDATVAAGANQINGISFGLRDPTAAENAARQLAVRALQAKVELYGRATGYHASRLVSLSEGGAYSPAPPMPMMTMARMKADTTPISAGELKVRIDVTGLYELTR